MGESHPRRSGRATYAVGGRVPGADCQAVRADPIREKHAAHLGSAVPSPP
jgi:hypothetical protein